jgi:hypothetical protein
MSTDINNDLGTQLYYYLDEYYPNWRDRYSGNYGMIIKIYNNQDDYSIICKTNIVNNIEDLPWNLSNIINYNIKLKEYINDCYIENINTLYFSIWFVYNLCSIRKENINSCLMQNHFDIQYLTDYNSINFERILTINKYFN